MDRAVRFICLFVGKTLMLAEALIKRVAHFGGLPRAEVAGLLVTMQVPYSASLLCQARHLWLSSFRQLTVISIRME
jgi:hypothetical protein